MAVFFLDNDQKVIKIVPDDGAISILQTQELPEDNSLMKDILSVRLKNDERLFNAQYMAVKSYDDNRNAFDMYRIVNEVVPDNATSFEGVQIAPYELEGTVIEDLRPQYRPLDRTMNQLLEDTDWRLGYMDDNLPTVSTNFYYVSVKDALKQLQDLLNIEFLFKVEISGNEITDKWVEVYREVGNRTLKRFNYGTNALTVKRETSSNELYTALIGRGKGEEVSSAEDNPGGQAGYGRKINFEDIEWSTDKGNPVNKPKGQKYIELPRATEEYGIKLIDGRKVPRVGIVEFPDTEEPEALINQTWQELQYYARPRVLFSATVAKIGDTSIGDTVTIHRHDLNMHYMTRVRKVVRNRKNDKQTQLEIGDVVHTPSTKRQSSINSKLNNIASDLNNVRNEVTNYVISADGENVITFSNDEPERKRVDDSWVRDHPSLAGETQWLVWDGEAWELIMDTSETTKNARAIEEQQKEIESTQARADEAVEEIDIAVENAGFTSLDATISSVQSISNTAEANAQTALNQSLDALDDASLAMTNAQAAINRADDLSGQVSDFELTVDGFNQVVNDYEGQVSQFENTVSGLSSTVATYEQAVSGYGTQVATLQNTIDGFNSTVQRVESDYADLSGTVNTHTTELSNLDGRISAKADQSTVDTLAGTVNSLGTDIGVVAGQINQRVWNTDIESAIDGIEVGGRNLLRNTNSELVQRTANRWGDVNVSSMTDSSNRNLLESKIVERNTSYVFRAWLDATNSDYSVCTFVRMPNERVTNRDVRGSTVKAGESGYSTIEFTVPDDAIEVNIFSIRFGQRDTPPTIIGTKWEKLEKGNTATDWTPAPEDTLARFDHIETEWTQTFDTFNQTVSGIDGRVTAQKQSIDSISSTVLGHGNRISTVEQTASGLQTTVASKANQSQVTQLSNAFNVYIEDASNLIHNPYFAGGLSDSWTIDQINNADKSDDIPREWYATHQKRDIYNTKEFAVRPGEIIELSLYAWGSAGSTALNIGLRYYDKNKEHLTWSTGGGRTTRGYITARMHIPENARFARFWIQQPLTSDFRTWWFTDAKATRSASHAQLSVMNDNINLRVEKGDVLGQINIEAGTTLIQNDKLLLDAGTVAFSGNAFIPGAYIENASMDGAKIQDATISSAKIANLDVNKISGNVTNFVQSNWNSATGGNVRATGDGIVSTAADGSQTLIQNGVTLTRQPNGSGIGTIGYVPDGTGSPVYRIQTSWGAHFALSQRFLDTYTGYAQEKESLKISTYDGGTTEVTLRASSTYITGSVDINSLNIRENISMYGNNINKAGQINFNYGSWMYDDYRNSNLQIVAGNKLRLYVLGASSVGGAGGNEVMAFDNTYGYMYRNLSMEGHNITNQSDIRLKTDISTRQESSLEKINQFNFVDFRWTKDGQEDFGVIAQQVQQVAPELILEGSDGYLSLNNSRLNMMTSHGLQELSAREANTNLLASENRTLIEKQQDKIKELEQRIKELESAA